MCLKFTISFNSKKRKWTHTSVAVTDDARAIEKSNRVSFLFDLLLY